MPEHTTEKKKQPPGHYNRKPGWRSGGGVGSRGETNKKEICAGTEKGNLKTDEILRGLHAATTVNRKTSTPEQSGLGGRNYYQSDPGNPKGIRGVAYAHEKKRRSPELQKKKMPEI